LGDSTAPRDTTPSVVRLDTNQQLSTPELRVANGEGVVFVDGTLTTNNLAVHDGVTANVYVRNTGTTASTTPPTADIRGLELGAGSRVIVTGSPDPTAPPPVVRFPASSSDATASATSTITLNSNIAVEGSTGGATVNVRAGDGETTRVTVQAGRTATVGSVTSNGDSTINVDGTMRHEGSVLQADVNVRSGGEVQIANNDAQVTGRVTVNANGDVRVSGDNTRFTGDVAIDGTARLEFSSVPPFYSNVVRCNGAIELHVDSVNNLQEGSTGVILRYDASVSATATNLRHCTYRLTDGTTTVELTVNGATTAPARRLLSTCHESTVTADSGQVTYTYCGLNEGAASSITASMISVILTIAGLMYFW
jgi:hypothetical protein